MVSSTPTRAMAPKIWKDDPMIALSAPNCVRNCAAARMGIAPSSIRSSLAAVRAPPANRVVAPAAASVPEVIPASAVVWPVTAAVFARMAVSSAAMLSVPTPAALDTPRTDAASLSISAAPSMRQRNSSSTESFGPMGLSYLRRSAAVMRLTVNSSASAKPSSSALTRSRRRRWTSS